MGADTPFEVLSSQGDWREVRLLSGQTGWAYAKYIGCCRDSADIAPQSTGAGKMSYVSGLDPTGDNWLAMRATPTDSVDNMLRKLPSGTRLNVVGRSGDWFQVRLQTGETGWAFSRYVACCR
jgi:SH3-like domain-containing protein